MSPALTGKGGAYAVIRFITARMQCYLARPRSDASPIGYVACPTGSHALGVMGNPSRAGRDGRRSM